MSTRAERGTSPWWLDKLGKELAERRITLGKFDDYYSGNHPLPFVSKAHESKIRSEFRMLLETERVNFMGLVVDIMERLGPYLEVDSVDAETMGRLRDAVALVERKTTTRS